MEEESIGNRQNKEFACFLCGTCCSRYQVRLSLTEARNICRRLDLDWQDFLERYTDPRWPGAESLLVAHRNGGCVFLKRSSGERTATCTIHNFKPSSCLEWTPEPFRQECREGLERYWGLGVDPGGNLIGTYEKLERFYRCTRSASELAQDGG